MMQECMAAHLLNYQSYRKILGMLELKKNYTALYTLCRKLNVSQSFIYLSTDYRNIGKETEHKICLPVDLRLGQREFNG